MAVKDASCPIQKMNIHLIISAFIFARSVFVARISFFSLKFLSTLVSIYSTNVFASNDVYVSFLRDKNTRQLQALLTPQLLKQ